MWDLDKILRNNPDVTVDETVSSLDSAQIDQLIASERQLQQAIFEECAIRALTNPLYHLVFAIPNGQYRPGERMEPGMKRGVLDIFCAVPKGWFHGMFMELKISPNGPSEDQLRWIKMLEEQKYLCVVVYDTLSAAMEWFDWYLDQTEDSNGPST